MPNWCHNKLTVEGDPDAVKRFVMAAATDEQPLSFAAIIPEPSKEVYAAMAEAAMVKCDLCGGSGMRPVNAAEAAAKKARWDASFEGIEYLKEQAALAIDDRAKCNGCQGRGKRVSEEPWLTWRYAHWGSKWDANFDGPFMAIGQAGADVEATVARQGKFDAPSTVLYDFTTAWSPPTPWVADVGPMYPELTFTLRYGEPGNDFAGEMIVHGDEITEKELAVSDVLGEHEMWF